MNAQDLAALGTTLLAAAWLVRRLARGDAERDGGCERCAGHAAEGAGRNRTIPRKRAPSAAQFRGIGRASSAAPREGARGP